MTNNQDSTYAEDWFRIASRDFARVSARLAEGDTEDAVFHLQQALEKGLKGFMLARGWELQRIHNLQLLLDDAVGFDPSLEVFRPLCQEANGYYLLERYPGLGILPEARELESILPQAETCLRQLGVTLEP
jgi:HEPN domain-containing protein